MSRLFFSPVARDDLLQLHDYIATDKPLAARRFIDQIEETCQLIATNPEMGERRDDLFSGVRVFSIGSYAILYRQAKNAVEICRVVHGARDFDLLF